MIKKWIFLTVIALSSRSDVIAHESTVLRAYNSSVANAVNEYVQETVINQDIQGMSLSVLVNGKVIHQKAFGFSDAKFKTPVDETTAFPIASITKLFVATAVHELLAEKKISIDTNIGSLLDTIPNHWKPVQIKHLLSHTSGLPDYYPIDSQPSSVQSALELVSHLPFVHPTGEENKYNQTGFALLHLLIEKLAGVSLQEYLLTKHIEKFNLQNTFYGQKRVESNLVTKAYRKTWKGIEDFDFSYPPALYASAGLNSSSKDLASWVAAMINGQILPFDTLLNVWELQPLTGGRSARFSLGWEFDETHSHIIVGHGGADTSAVRHFIHKSTGDSVTVIWLSNTLGYYPGSAVSQVASYFMEDLPVCSTFLFWKFGCET